MTQKSRMRGGSVQAWYVVGGAMLVLLLRVWHLLAPDVLIDDAYISFRYAQNMARGLGLVFNHGERTEGYTNFLWTALLGVSAFLGGDLVIASHMLAGIAASTTIWILYLFGRRLSGHQAGDTLLVALPMFLFAVMGAQARYVVSGMETMLFTCLVTGALYLTLYTSHPLHAGLSWAVAALTRPEGVMYWGLALGYLVLMVSRSKQNPPDAWHALGLFVGGFLLLWVPYWLWRYSYYGELLPNTYYAKSGPISWSRTERGWEHLRYALAQWRIDGPLVLAALALTRARSRPVLFLLAAYAAATTGYFLLVGGDFVIWFGPRFLTPVLPLVLLLAAEGVRVVVALLAFVGLPVRVGVRLIAVVLLLHVGLLGWPAYATKLDEFGAQMRGWKELGLWMKEHVASGTTIATDAVGIIPFYSGLPTIDMYGLTDRHIAHITLPGNGVGVVAHEKTDPVYVLTRQPGCVVSTFIDGEGRPLTASLPSVAERFDANYQLVAVARLRAVPGQPWVRATAIYSSELSANGYATGLYCRRVTD